MIDPATKRMVDQLLSLAPIYQYAEAKINGRVSTPLTVLYAPPGHYYSPLPDVAQVENNIERLYAAPDWDDGVDLNLGPQHALLAELAPYFASFDWQQQAQRDRRFHLKNNFFDGIDAIVLYAMLRHFRPRHIIEVGSGFSSALMLDTNDRLCDPKMELCFIEPYPDRLTKLVTPQDRSSTQLITAPVQNVPLEEFDRLEPNDILFIDSSHVSKIGSDVNHLLFSVLPRLRPGVLVHFHDVFYPFEYPIQWLREGRAWNEIYLLRAFLQYNSVFEIQLFNSYLWHQSPEILEKHLPTARDNSGGSIWLKKVSA